MLKTVFLLLGCNIDDCKNNFAVVKALIEKKIGPIDQESNIYASKAWGNLDQADFLNQVIKVKTSHGPFRLLSLTQSIEKELGRIKRVKWGPREIDIDLLFLDEIILHSKKLKIPHPGIVDRKFTLMPLNDIASEMLHPGYNKTIKELLKECNDEGRVWQLEKAQ